MSPITYPGPHYAEGCTLRIVLRKVIVAGRKRLAKARKRAQIETQKVIEARRRAALAVATTEEQRAEATLLAGIASAGALLDHARLPMPDRLIGRWDGWKRPR